MIQNDNRLKCFYNFGKSMKNYSISKWVLEILNIFLNFFAIIGVIAYVLIYGFTVDYNINMFFIIYFLFMFLFILLYLVSALVNFVFFIIYLVNLSNSSKHDNKYNLKKSFTMEIISIVLLIILPITLEMVSLIVSYFVPAYYYTIIPSYDFIYYDLTYISLIVTIIIFVVRIINGIIPRIFKASAQKKLRNWTYDLFEFPASESESVNLETSITDGSKLMRIGQILGIFRIVRIFGKITYIVGLGKTGKGLMKSFEKYKTQVPAKVRYYTNVPQKKIRLMPSDVPIFCAYCGSTLFPNSKFCGKCGKSLP